MAVVCRRQPPLILMFFFLIIISVIVVTSEARLLPVYGNSDKKIDNNILLHKLGINVHERNYNIQVHQMMAAGEATIARGAPDGPDPQHHFIPSAKP